MYGSLNNRIYEAMTIDAPKPEVGMGATITGYTDRHAATVVAWDAASRIITVQHDNVRRTDNNGMSESQVYEYTANPQGAKQCFRQNKTTGRWEPIRFNPETNRWNKTRYGGLILGFRDEYYDFSF